MTDSSASKRSSLSSIGWLSATAVGLFLTGFVAACLVWLLPGGGVWRSEVIIVNAELRSPDTLALIVDTCAGNPEVSLLQETDVDVQLKVVASSTPFRGGPECQDLIELQLLEPLADRVVVDTHTGQVVNVDIIDWSADQ